MQHHYFSWLKSTILTSYEFALGNFRCRQKFRKMSLTNGQKANKRSMVRNILMRYADNNITFASYKQLASSVN